MTFLELWGYIRDGGTLAVLLLIIVGGWRQDYVWSWYVAELRARETAKDALIKEALEAARSGRGLANRALQHVEERRDNE